MGEEELTVGNDQCGCGQDADGCDCSCGEDDEEGTDGDE
jgi:hypothetical protein